MCIGLCITYYAFHRLVACPQSLHSRLYLDHGLDGNHDMMSSKMGGPSPQGRVSNRALARKLSLQGSFPRPRGKQRLAGADVY